MKYQESYENRAQISASIISHLQTLEFTWSDVSLLIEKYSHKACQSSRRAFGVDARMDNTECNSSKIDD